MEPQSSQRFSLWPLKGCIKLVTLEIRIFYLHVYLSSEYKVPGVYLWHCGYCGYIVPEQKL
jgi:hypothetical protein